MFLFSILYKAKLGHLKKCFIELGPQCKKVTFEGKATIAVGCNIIVNAGEVLFGNGFSANTNCIYHPNLKMVVQQQFVIVRKNTKRAQ